MTSTSNAEVLAGPGQAPPVGAETPRARSRARGAQSVAVNLIRLVGIAALLLIWYVLGVLDQLHGIPTVAQVARAWGGALHASRYWSAIGHTAEGWAIGLAIGATAGLLIGSLLASSLWAERSCVVVVEFFKTVPVVAVLPLAILVLGTTIKMKIILVAFGVTWPLLVQTMYGVKSLDPVIRDTATAMGVGRLRMFFRVVIPSAMPYVATGLRVASAGALILTVIIELTVGGHGIGVEITTAAISGNTAIPLMWAYILTAGVFGILVTLSFSFVERRLLRWHEAYRPGARA
jgi:ABC-type nitrate/sulfonate/bicarbonate transport system permease component